MPPPISIYVTWDNFGNVNFRIDEQRFAKEFIEQLYSMAGVSLIDHMFTTLPAKNAVDLCEKLMRGIVDNKLDIYPIGAELKSAIIEVKAGKVMYTLFKPQEKWLADNQKTENAWAQMTINTIAMLLKVVSEENNTAIRLAAHGIISSYEHNLRRMFEINENRYTTRMNVAKAAAYFLNTFPVTQKELLDERLKDADQIIEKWKSLPFQYDHPIF
jgi:hypothetical protein